MRGDTYRLETWGLVGAIDDQDLERIISLVIDLNAFRYPAVMKFTCCSRGEISTRPINLSPIFETRTSTLTGKSRSNPILISSPSSPPVI
jgi:hypothetical protein